MKKSILVLVLLISTMATFNCETDVPATDTIQPEITLNIKGDGLNHDFLSTDDPNGMQLNLKERQEYQFMLSASDQGGLKVLAWMFPKDYLTFTSDLPESWSRRSVSELADIFECLEMLQTLVPEQFCRVDLSLPKVRLSNSI